MRKLISQLGTWIANLGLLGILSFNLIQLYQKAAQQAQLLAGIKQNPGQLLTDHPEALLQKIQDAGVPWWAWIISWGGLAITLALIILWFVIRKPAGRLMLLRVNLIWIGLWLLYFVGAIILVTYAFANLL